MVIHGVDHQPSTQGFNHFLLLCDKLLQTHQLRTIKIYYVTVSVVSCLGLGYLGLLLSVSWAETEVLTGAAHLPEALAILPRSLVVSITHLPVFVGLLSLSPREPLLA